MSNLIYDPSISSPMNVAVFLSGRGTNFRELYREQNRLEGLSVPRYGRISFVFSDKPDCEGLATAKGLILTKTIDSRKFNQGLEIKRLADIPLDHPARISFDALSIHMMEQILIPDLVCLAGYERWLSPYFVDRYRSRILNVHPGDTSKGYIGLEEIPTANAILAGEEHTRSTIFLVDESKDGGPVLVQSHPIPIYDNSNNIEVIEIGSIKRYAQQNGFHTVRDFRNAVKEETGVQSYLDSLLIISRRHQEKMKEQGDWPSYKFAVHHLVAQGRVAVDGRDVYVDGNKLPPYGFRLDEHHEEFERSGITI